MNAMQMTDTSFTPQVQGSPDANVANIVTVDTNSVAVNSTTSVQADPVSAPNSWGAGSSAGWIGLAVSVCVGVIAWRIISSLKKEIDILKQSVAQLNSEKKNLRDELDNLSSSFNSQKLDFDSLRKDYSAITQRSSSNSQQTSQQNVLRKDIGQPKSAKKVLYATLQSPDENGVLRFSERSMIEKSSSQKLFQVEIDLATGTGIYKINPDAIPMILADLQMLKDFVKPFSFSGNSSTATIKDKRVGRITKQGSFWIVDEPLEISIS